MDIDRVGRRIQRRVSRLPVGTRQELLRVLAYPPERRAELIGQMYERPETRELAEVLMDLEAEPLMWLDMMEALKESVRRL